MGIILARYLNFWEKDKRVVGEELIQYFLSLK